MRLTAKVEQFNGRPMLFINEVPTTEFWCYGDPNAIDDFVACGLRICQFHVPFPSWWTGPGQYNFEPIDRKIETFLERAPSVLLLPRVNFGYEGELWWGQQNPQELAVGHDLQGNPIDYQAIRARPVDCWFSSGSQTWTRDAAAAMRALVSHCEEKFSDRILGYQIGGGISAEWFRWWNFVEEVYEDYSTVAEVAFRRYLQEKYGEDHALQQAWHREDVTLATAAVPPPRRLHEPENGYFRDPATERDVVDWLECLSYGNTTQILALVEAAKQASENRKIIGTFYGYMWPHWNTRSPARAGHLGLQRILANPAVDFISSPFHYDNRHLGGFHHSQTVPQTIERAGKLHLDEIDTYTHLARPETYQHMNYQLPRTARESCMLLRRDAAAVLGTAGNGWWMDLHHDRWYNDPEIQSEMRQLARLGIQSLDWPCNSHAQVALVVDNHSYAWSHLWSPLNQFYTSMQRQLAWSDLGFPIDTITPGEIDQRDPYRLYIFVNCWYADTPLRERIQRQVRRPGITALWFHGCGYINEQNCSAANASELIGMQLALLNQPETPMVELLDSDLSLLSRRHPDQPARFGACIPPDMKERIIGDVNHDWSAVTMPRFAVNDPRAVGLGRYAGSSDTGLAILEQDGWRSIFCGAPLLPGWLLANIATETGIHRYTSDNAQVFHRGPFLAVYKPQAGALTVTAPEGMRLQPLIYETQQDNWRPDPQTEPTVQWQAEFEKSETKFFLTSPHR